MSEQRLFVQSKNQPVKSAKRQNKTARPGPSAAALKAKRAPSYPYSAKRKKGLSPLYIIGNAAALVVIVMLVLFAWAKEGSDPMPVVSEPTPIVEEAVVATPDNSLPAVNMIDPNMPQGLVTVPRIGLRRDHSFNAKIMKVNVRRGDRVGIIKRYAPSAGPGWLLVRTAPGSVGWIVSSVVKE